MRRSLLVTVTILVTITLLPSPTVQTQQPEKDQFPKPHNPEKDVFPKPETYPQAGPNCKNKQRLQPWLGMPDVGPGKSRCVLSVSNCQTGTTDVYRSAPRESGTVALDCSDYVRADEALLNIEVCCDKPPEKDCKNEVELSVSDVTETKVGNMIRCEFSTQACDITTRHRSDERESTVGCADFRARAEALRNRKICCDKENLHSEARMPGCKEENMPPWFDTDAKCDNPIFFSQPAPQAEPSTGGVICHIHYSVCGSRIDQQRSQYFSTGALNAFRIMSLDEALKFCASKGFGRDAVPYRKVCCPKWRQANAEWIAFRRRNGPDAPGGPCGPLLDADCDGLPNLDDPTPLGDCARYPTSHPR